MAAALVGSTFAHAAEEDCGKSTRRWIAVRFVGPGIGPELADSVLTDLRAEVRRHGIMACPAENQESQGLPPPIVTLVIEAAQATAMRLSLDVTDPISGKRAARELQLDAMPLDGHSLAVAVAADELLTSSFLKLASRPIAEGSEAVGPPPTPPPTATPTQGAVVATVPPSNTRAPSRYEVAALAAAEHFEGGAWTPGIDLALRRWLLPRWALELDAGVRSLLDEEAPHGRARSRAVPISLRLLAGLVPFTARARMGAAAVLTARTLFYNAEAEAGAVASSQTALAIYLSGELWADVAFGPVRLRLAGGVGAPLRSVTADDTGVPVGGARGLELHGQAGLMVGL